MIGKGCYYCVTHFKIHFFAQSTDEFDETNSITAMAVTTEASTTARSSTEIGTEVIGTTEIGTTGNIKKHCYSFLYVMNYNLKELQYFVGCITYILSISNAIYRDE